MSRPKLYVLQVRIQTLGGEAKWFDSRPMAHYLCQRLADEMVREQKAREADIRIKSYP